MAQVLIEGVFMGVEVINSTYDGVTKTNLVVDVYQPKSKSTEKTVTLKTDNIELLNEINSNFAFGDVIKVDAQVNAYKNKAYFKLLNVAV